MSKEKQIESLIHEIRLGVMKGGIGWRTVQIAEQLYDAGYRKQGEGEWNQQMRPYDDFIECSSCGKWFNIIDNCTEKFKFCPNCGAKMKGGE